MADFKDENAQISEEKALIKEEISSLKRLLKLAENKRDALLKEDIDTLMRLLKAEEEELKVLEGIRPPEANGAQKPDPATEDELLQERKALAQEVKALNEFNQQLIGDSLAYIHFMLQILQGESDKSTYGAKGTMEAKAANPLIDLKG